MKRICDVGQRVPPVSILKTLIGAFVLALGLFCIGLHAQETSSKDNVRFLAVDIYVDSKGKPLAAYQLEFSVTNGNAKIAGIEGGEHPAFREPPFYDPKAMQQERVIIAAFSTAEKLPSGKTRVATIHVQVSGSAKPQFFINLQIAADMTGKIMQPEASFIERSSP